MAESKYIYVCAPESFCVYIYVARGLPEALNYFGPVVQRQYSIPRSIYRYVQVFHWFIIIFKYVVILYHALIVAAFSWKDNLLADYNYNCNIKQPNFYVINWHDQVTYRLANFSTSPFDDRISFLKPAGEDYGAIDFRAYTLHGIFQYIFAVWQPTHFAHFAYIRNERRV